MKAITVWQPWASLIAIGAKPYEFRGWKPPAALVGQRIAIHAGARETKWKEMQPFVISTPVELAQKCLNPNIAGPFFSKVVRSTNLILSHVLCTAVLGKPVLANEIVGQFGMMNDSDRDEHFNWAWPLYFVIELKPPVPARGAQGLWDWTP